MSTYNRQYYLQNKQARLASQRKYRSTAKGKAKDRRYENTERGKVVRKRVTEKWRDKNTEKIRVYNFNRFRTPEGRYSLSKARANSRKYEWSITLPDYRELISLACFYCEGKLSPAGIGLDRVDNRLGYIPGNVVPCCKRCNDLKGRGSFNDFIERLLFNEKAT